MWGVQCTTLAVLCCTVLVIIDLEAAEVGWQLAVGTRLLGCQYPPSWLQSPDI